MSTVPVYGYGRKDYGHLTGTGDPYPYRIDIVEHGRRYGTAYGTAVLRAYGKYGSDTSFSPRDIADRRFNIVREVVDKDPKWRSALYQIEEEFIYSVASLVVGYVFGPSDAGSKTFKKHGLVFKRTTALHLGFPDIDEDNNSGNSMTSHLDGSAAPSNPTFVQDVISDVHAPWDAGPVAAGQRTIEHWGGGDNRYPQGLRTQSSDSSAYSDYDSLYESAHTMAINPAGTVFHSTASTSFPPGLLWNEMSISASPASRSIHSRSFTPIVRPIDTVTSAPPGHEDPHPAARSTPVTIQRDTSDNFKETVIHAVRRSQPCPSGYEVKRFAHEMSLKIAQEYSIPYEDVCYYYRVDEGHHRCPIAGCKSGQNTFRGDTIKTHLESYHPNITAMQKVVCVRKSHQTSKCPTGNGVKGKSYEQHFREKHSDAHSLCPFCGRRYSRANYIFKHLKNCKKLWLCNQF
ncbi:hypothetical protein ARMSODRAFT_1027032 [Armillaria solidipes]|uniref:Uncharacterized protein n=1 Tax=Armillaria solidipes TaxID=1076256 RepID=A0A2H3B1N3_9AGAR|nr:hypothetical protein ARMSODRAFT_1027032 [Armillaria solidipes]